MAKATDKDKKSKKEVEQLEDDIHKYLEENHSLFDYWDNISLDDSDNIRAKISAKNDLREHLENFIAAIKDENDSDLLKYLKDNNCNQILKPLEKSQPKAKK